LLHQVEKILLMEQLFVNVGAYSSKPNAAEVSVQEEENRLLPVVELLLKFSRNNFI
jgi:dihydropteroate synthase